MTPPNTVSDHDLPRMDVPQHETEFCVYFNGNGGIVYDDNICPHDCHNSNNLLLVTGDHVHCGYCGTAIGKKNVKWHLNGCAVYKQLSARAPLASAAAPSPSAPRASAPSAPLMSLVSTLLPLQPSAAPSCASTPTPVSAGQLILECTSEGSGTTRDTVRTATKSVGTWPDGACMAWIPSPNKPNRGARTEEWIPQKTCCLHHRQGEEACQWVLRGFETRTVYDVGGSVDVPVRHYHCSTHFVKKKAEIPGREVRRSLLATDIHAELADTQDMDINNPINAFQGGPAFTLACAIHIWHCFVDNGFNIRHVARNMRRCATPSSAG